MRRIAALVALAAAGCSSGAPACDASSHLGCPDDQTCETVVGASEPACVAPLLLRGTVRDATAGGVIGGARVSVYGVDETPLGTAATSGDDGAFELAVHAARDASHKPVSLPLHLRAWAAGYGAYPLRWQTWPSIDAAGAQVTPPSDQLVLATGDTDVSLLAFAGGPGVGELCGTVAVARGAQAPLVVGDFGTGAVAVRTDDSGAFHIFGIPPGAVRLQAYASGTAFVERDLDLGAGDMQCRDLAVAAGAAPVRVSGSVQRPPGSTATPTVALVVASTWDPDTSAGDVPPGLTATVAQDGSFAIAGVPPGKYVVVAALESDGLVQLDAPPPIDVGSSDFVLPAPIRLADSLAVISPGAAGPQVVKSVPTLSWQDATMEASYRLTVHNALGLLISQRDEPAHHGDAPAVLFDGNLVPGMPYRFRAEALDAGGNVITRTEDLLGIFTFAP